MLVFLYAFHDCDYHRAVPLNQSAGIAWQKAAACKQADLEEILQLITWLVKHKGYVAHKFMNPNSCRIYYSERGSLL